MSDSIKSKLYSRRNKEEVKFVECFPLFGSATEKRMH
jgi:hypothetical protein